MARTINEQAHAEKRREILDITQRLIYTKGYEQMSLRDILDELQISKGALYHYYDSKPALLEAVIARTQDDMLQLLTPIVRDPRLPALEKLQRYIDVGVRWKTEHKEFLIELLRVWYNDHNAIVRQKLWATISKQAMPLFAEIIHQGVREGVFNIAFPDYFSPIVLSTIQSMGDGFAELLLADEHPRDLRERAERMVDAYTDALERILGARPGSIRMMDAEALYSWFGAPSDGVAEDVGAVETA